jgi:hypothetical protein
LEFRSFGLLVCDDSHRPEAQKTQFLTLSYFKKERANNVRNQKDLEFGSFGLLVCDDRHSQKSSMDAKLEHH